MKWIIAIVGPTAAGKSKLALSLAQTFDGEIVSADSRQIYRYMDIGTAKPSLEERARIPHHLIDIVNPDETFSLALYQPPAYKAIEDILQRGKLPLVVGGSGLYVWSVLEGWHIPQVPPDYNFRRQMEEKAAREGTDSLYRQLEKVDPVAARKIDPRNVRRVIRALEVCEATHTPFSQLQGKELPPFNTFILGLTTHRKELYRRIDYRVDNMIKQGLVEEVEALADRGYRFELPAMSSVGYKQIGQFLRGKVDLAAAIQQIKFETHRFARHQYAWFSLKDSRIRWFDMSEQRESDILPLVEKEIKGRIRR
jgi:tRNA dimethylallyltransferase